MVTKRQQEQRDQQQEQKPQWVEAAGRAGDRYGGNIVIAKRAVRVVVHNVLGWVVGTESEKLSVRLAERLTRVIRREQRRGSWR